MELTEFTSEEFNQKVILMKFLKADLQRYYKNQSRYAKLSTTKKIHLILANYGLHAIFVYRFGNLIETKIIDRKFYLIKKLLLGVYCILNFLIIKMYDIKISRHARIAKGIYINHFSGIIISKCIIGENCTLHQRVQIEGNDSDLYKENCLIGNNVWIGPHAIIKKGIKIGDGAAISAGSIVQADVERNCLAIGNPAKILKKNFDNSELNL